MSNRLAGETSPYLRQHQENPVDWYPWGDEALAKARSENKPILLSIGYSACHWCHVMAHESFENPEIARLMNENFVNIKVDREERPDLDHVYQKVAQIMTHGGGWPLTVFLTPDLKPFYGGTYFPPDDRYGRPGFPRVLVALADVYRKEPEKVSDNAQKLTEAIASVETLLPGNKALPTPDGLKQIAGSLLGIVDWDTGGVGSAPKFPNAMTFSYLWRIGQATGDFNGRRATTLSLTRMAEGGIYDQLGGGFHRYSVDPTWSVPHFEKMLYDNGLLLKLYAEVLLDPRPGLQNEEQALYLKVLRETVDYVLREMRSSEGGFYAAQDADSEGEEGKFFVWDLQDLKQHLSEDEAKVVARRYGVRDGGNFEHGKTVLAVQQTITADEELLLASARVKLLAARGKRIAPGLDDKILASWNGLMISGLAWAGQALRHYGDAKDAARAFEAANAAFDFVARTMDAGNDRLKSVYKEGKARFNAYLDDYAFLAMAALDLARFSENPEQVNERTARAAAWIAVILKHFKVRGTPGYSFTSDDHEKLLQRPHGVHDQAIPSGTSVAIECLLALAEIFPEQKYAAEAAEQLETLFPAALEQPFGMSELACAALMQVTGPVTLTGAEAAKYCEHPHVFQKIAENASARGTLVCHRQTCSQPIDDPAELEQRVLDVLAI